jgi:AcrR family transcriptional regulator
VERLQDPGADDRGGKAQKRSGEITRRRIVLAAAVRFAQTSYEEVTLRDIARDVGVDVAHVHRSFGSKENLFAEVLRATFSFPEVRARRNKDLVAAFTASAFDRNAAGLGVFINSLPSQQARKALRAHGLANFVEPLAANLPEPASERAILIAAVLAGVRLVRDVLGDEAGRFGSSKVSRPLIEAVFRTCLGETSPSERQAAEAHSPRPVRSATKSGAARQAAKRQGGRGPKGPS